MGFFSGIYSGAKKILGSVTGAIFGSGISSNSGSSRSTSTTIYEPDKVKIAEIEKKTAELEMQRQLKLAEAEKLKAESLNQTQIKTAQITTENKIKLAEVEKKKAEIEQETAKLEKERQLKLVEAEKLKIQIERDKQIKLAELEKLKAADFNRAKIKTAQLKAESELKLAEEQTKQTQINAENQIRLSELETERVELIKQAKIEMLHEETEARILVEEAKAKGFTVMAQTILTLQEKLNEVAEKRLLIIEKASMPIIKEIEQFYGELDTKIREDNNLYTKEKLPELLNILNQFPTNSPAQTLYLKQIENDMANQFKHYSQQIDNVAERQKMVLNSFLKGKEQIIGQTETLTKTMLENLNQQAQLAGADISRQLSDFGQTKQLQTDKKPALENKK